MLTHDKLCAPPSESDHRVGRKDAPLVLVEYGDYECPYCAQAEETVRQLRDSLEEDICYIYRHFPLLDIHPQALDAAKAAEAAGMQGRFWEMHELLYGDRGELDAGALRDYAEQIGLEIEKFIEDMQSPEVEKKIKRDRVGGERSGVDGTPTFFINGSRYEGDESYSALLECMEKLRSRGGESGMKKAG